MNQQELDIKTEEKTPTNVSDFRFAPIKGQPMLQWRGKRPFTSTSYFPAQEKEQHGEEVDGWLNKIFWGDNIQVMSHLLKEYRGKVDLIYIDPPFDSKADYKKTIELKGKKIANDHSNFEEKQYTDIWTNDEYLGSSANCRKPFCPAATHPNTAGHFGKPRCRVGTPPLPGCIRRSALQPIIP